MKLGLVTDIHEHVENLQTAFDRFQVEHVDQVVVIGDVFETGRRIAETCGLLEDAKAVGVWGNHDYGLCYKPDIEVSRYGPSVLRFMSTLRPRLDLAGCHFSHVEPWLNPEEVADLWYYDGPPNEHGKLDRIFNAVPQRLMFAGHYHQWLLTTPMSISNWAGERPISLSDGRYFVVIGALCDGCYAILDTESSMLTPFKSGG